MPLTKNRRATLMTLFRKRKYRRVYVESYFNTRLAAQIRLLRESQGLSQQQLAESLSTQQSAISKLENGAYSSWSVKTLRRLARAFDLVLQIGFVSFGEALADIDDFSRATLLKPSFRDDPVFLSLSGSVTETAKAKTNASTFANWFGQPGALTAPAGVGLLPTFVAEKSRYYWIAVTIDNTKQPAPWTWANDPATQPTLVAANDNLALAS